MSLNNSDQLSDSAGNGPAILLEVHSGKTLFPHRPVHEGRFLIGAAEPCDLRLGGFDIPSLHSLIVTREDNIYIEQVAAEPELVVNGELVEQSSLNDGDEIEIGEFRFRVRPAHDLKQNEPVPAVAPNGAVRNEQEHLEEDISQLSAAELVERIEREEAMVQEFDEGVTRGVQSLMRAIADHAPVPIDDADIVTSESVAGIVKLPIPDDTPESDDEVSLPEHLRIVAVDHTDELEHLVELLDGIVGNLSRHAETLTARESALESMAERLTAQQTQLAEQLEQIVAQIDALKGERDLRLKSA